MRIQQSKNIINSSTWDAYWMKQCLEKFGHFGKNNFMRIYFCKFQNIFCETSLCEFHPHFDYKCSVWYPNLSKKLKKIQTIKNSA